MLVQATDKYEKLNLKDNELGRIPKKGEIFGVTKERYEVLTRTNKFNAVFVEEIDEAEEVQIATKKVKTEKTAKKTTAKKATSTRKKK